MKSQYRIKETYRGVFQVQQKWLGIWWVASRGKLAYDTSLEAARAKIARHEAHDAFVPRVVE